MLFRSPPGDCNQTNGVEERVPVGDKLRLLQYGIQKETKEFEQVRSQYFCSLKILLSYIKSVIKTVYTVLKTYIRTNRPRSNFVIGTYSKATPVKFRQYINYMLYM